MKNGQSIHTLQPLQVKDHAYIQNLIGNHPRKWKCTGVVVETCQFHQYVVCIDGSGRVTLSKRQHLRKFTPFQKIPEPIIKATASPPPTSSEKSHMMMVDLLQLTCQPLYLHPYCLPLNPNLQAIGTMCLMIYQAYRNTSMMYQCHAKHVQQTFPQKLARALARPLPHNRPGELEQLPVRPRQSKPT
ncbi:transcription factor iiib 90 kda subunit [Plakobranchus ocellatus]|uniref:Transcription factor iiib 90 kDa subunit n=1 Tax=Plakobranchus ocellatus TaxID=259542 RepID=A0AAV4B1D8_9GAST|nr:transcription factor iiib 90 kda subunit [Plakobranchus ocellatus]